MSDDDALINYYEEQRAEALIDEWLDHEWARRLCGEPRHPREVPDLLPDDEEQP